MANSNSEPGQSIWKGTIMNNFREGFELEVRGDDLALERKLVSDEEKGALLQALEAWLDEQTHFRAPGPETGFHLKILRAAEFSLDRAKKLAEEYVSSRVEMPQVTALLYHRLSCSIYVGSSAPLQYLLGLTMIIERRSCCCCWFRVRFSLVKRQSVTNNCVTYKSLPEFSFLHTLLLIFFVRAFAAMCIGLWAFLFCSNTLEP